MGASAMNLPQGTSSHGLTGSVHRQSGCSSNTAQRLLLCFTEFTRTEGTSCMETTVHGIQPYRTCECVWERVDVAVGAVYVSPAFGYSDAMYVGVARAELRETCLRPWIRGPPVGGVNVTWVRHFWDLWANVQPRGQIAPTSTSSCYPRVMRRTGQLCSASASAVEQHFLSADKSIHMIYHQSTSRHMGPAA